MQIYNTLARAKQPLQSIQPGKFRMYACGPTVYNYFHIGNARPFVIFDTLRRYLTYRGYDVTFVQNFTDIDDKMIKRANEEGITVKELGDRFIAEYFKDADALGIQRASVHPKATEHMPEIIALVQKLIDTGHAYAVEGDVYYDVHSFPGYGKLSGQPMENLEAGARILPGERKRDPMDFALWKAQKPGEPAWDSPWGKGRPGWHIECSAMSGKYLGDTFDLHCGGQDLIFPHHENEIAQSEGAHGCAFANCWMHNGYINIDNEKMSKSLGNFFTVRDIAEKYDLMALRLFLLSAHYRNPINFSWELIEQSKAALERLRNTRDNLLHLSHSAPAGDACAPLLDKLAGYKAHFLAAMDDDLNTADAIGSLFEIARTLNSEVDETSTQQTIQACLALFDELTGVLGIQVAGEQAVDAAVLELVEQRQAARAAKDWAASDALRDQIKALGYTVEDTPTGPKVKAIG